MIVLLADVLAAQGPSARDIHGLWWLMLVLGTAVFVLFGVLLVMAFRRSGDDSAPEEPVQQSRVWLYGGGVALPAIGVLVVLAATLVVMQRTPETVAAEESPVTVEAVASQFWWEFRYPGTGVVTATELHIPAGEPVQLRIESTDVIHSLWVPELAGKRDALPGNTTFLVIEADRPGTFRGQCAEFCGLGHALMEVVVIAHDRQNYEQWLASRQQPADAPMTTEAERGMELFLGNGGCARCHTIRGTAAGGEEGPDLTHFASRGSIGSGRLENTAEHLRQWIHDPGAVKSGVRMPPSDLPPRDIAAIAAYLEGLK